MQELRNIQELRIGNWVQDYYLKIPYQITIDHLRQLANFDYVKFQQTIITHIKLTQEILENNCGFEKIDFDYFELKTEENFYCHIDELGFGFALEHETFYICEYVHELQNLYFALTGEELKVNYEKNI